MMFNWLKIAAGTAAAVIYVTCAAQAADVLASKEYKILLTPSLFDKQPATVANQFLTDLKAQLKTANFDRSVDGKFTEDETRTVRFYDSPGTCDLNASGYMLRTRGDDAASEITLKFRSSSQSTAAAADVSGSVSRAKTKLEDDIVPPFKETFSHSTTEPLAATKKLNSLDDVTSLFPGIASLNLPTKDILSLVGKLDITERTYTGVDSDLGAKDADFSLTLWYVGTAAKPAIAELSFKVKSDGGAFNNKVTERSKLLFDTLQGMTQWVSSSSTTKTHWVYQYQPGFCSSVKLL
ncbi:hypothetical protein [Candidatus Phyllobacterium onerii]|uniref:hypothetical protein n=1 Tax=Candidatus Phyllobacterium onerii TaxID=3020828 RepID=UPI00232F6DB2|nr:hypothetical protein [Phyllobacterium sp. IY22]